MISKGTKDQAWKLKAWKLPQSSVPHPEPFALWAQLAECCHFTSSLFFYAFYLRAREELCEEFLRSYYYWTIFSFVLITQELIIYWSSWILDFIRNKNVFTRFLFIKRLFSFVLIQKKQKINPEYFYTKNHRTNFPIATPAARVSHSTRGSLPSANTIILTVIFWFKNIRAGWSRNLDWFCDMVTIMASQMMYYYYYYLWMLLTS